MHITYVYNITSTYKNNIGKARVKVIRQKCSALLIKFIGKQKKNKIKHNNNDSGIRCLITS